MSARPRYIVHDYNRTDTLHRRQAIARMPMEKAEPRMWLSAIGAGIGVAAAVPVLWAMLTVLS
jgi:hypothetical protein